MTFPIDIINIILIYVGELDDIPFILQYSKNKKYYKINPHASYFIPLQALITMKRLYRLTSYECILNNRMLYMLGKRDYIKKILKEKNINFSDNLLV